MLPRPFICQAAYIYIKISILISEIAFENDSTLNVLLYINVFLSNRTPKSFSNSSRKKAKLGDGWLWKPVHKKRSALPEAVAIFKAKLNFQRFMATTNKLLHILSSTICINSAYIKQAYKKTQRLTFSLPSHSCDIVHFIT